MYKKSQARNTENHEKGIFFHRFKYFSTNDPAISIKTYLVKGLLTVLTILIILYIVIEFLIVLNMINKKDQISLRNETDIKSAKVEKEYNKITQTLNKEYALNHGFVSVDMNNFVSRKDTVASLSFLYGGER